MPNTICKTTIAALLSLVIFSAQNAYSQDDDLEKAQRFDQKASALAASGKYAEAIPSAKKALELWQRALGPEHHHIVAGLNNLAELYRELGQYAWAEPLYQKALTMSEKLYGTDHPHVASLLNNLSLLNYSLGKYDKANSLQKRALSIREKAFGPDHPEVALSLNNLAAVYQKSGQWDEAERLYKRALAIRQEAFGRQHPDVAINLNNLAELYRSMGEYARAESFYGQVLEIWEETLGKSHPHLSVALNNLALLYFYLGDYSQAERLYKQALQISEQSYGKDHPNVASLLRNLGMLYEAKGDYDDAQGSYRRALQINKKVFGYEHPDVALNIESLASVFFAQEKYKAAERLLKEFLLIIRGSLGPRHAYMAMGLNNLGLLYSRLGQYEKAETLYSKALEINENALGPWHPDLAVSLNNLALVSAATGDYLKAHKYNLQAERIESRLLENIMGFTSEEQKIKFLSKIRGRLYTHLSLVAQHLSHNRQVCKEVCDLWLKRKGIVLETQRRFQDAILYSGDAKAIQTFQVLSRVRSQLSRLAFLGPGKGGVDVFKRRVAELRNQKEELEVKLSKLSQPFALKREFEKANCENVTKALPEGTVLIDFARIERFDFKAKKGSKRWKPPHYLVFLLRRNGGAQVEILDLGTAENIDQTVAQFRKGISKPGAFKQRDVDRLSKELHRSVFLPIKSRLGGVKEIYVSPDGNLNLIPFEVLKEPSGRFLIQDYTFNYLSAGRDVLSFKLITNNAKKALLIGDPDFDMTHEEKNSYLRKLALKKQEQDFSINRSTQMRKFHFSRLQKTREEVEAIHRILGKEKSEVYTGKKALEAVIMQKNNPKILHLATHGFFLDDLELAFFSDHSAGREIHMVTLSSHTPQKGKFGNPLTRSGIVLAGANHALAALDPEKSDGIVTAEKILSLRLRGTEMVVLSACETGLGEVKSGEGVFGLRRAFTQAGAKSLVMSMWSVPDSETKELMVAFYKNIVSGKMNRCQSLRQAILKEMQIVKKRYGHVNPLYWGAFVFMGEP
jgi:CHAT domain-containing protein/tetratricopeptide (TPR) repeat protein